jgi:hypothetical protein
MSDRVDDGAPRRLELHGHVDAPAVAWAHDALRADPGPRVLDLRPARSWDRDAVTAMTMVLDGPHDGLAVVAPRASSFLGLLDATDLRETWAVYDEVRRLRRAAGQHAPRPAVRVAANGGHDREGGVLGPADSAGRDLRTSSSARVLSTLTVTDNPSKPGRKS